MPEHAVMPSPPCHFGCLGCAQTSLDVLTSEEARRLYDWGVQRALRGDADDYVWPFETDVTQKNFIPLGNPPRPVRGTVLLVRGCVACCIGGDPESCGLAHGQCGCCKRVQPRCPA